MKLIRLEETVSTNRDAFGYLEETDPVAVIADRQTGGRGRGRNTWVSSPGNLHMSVGATCPVSHLRNLSVRAGIRLASALNLLLERPVLQVKWPNDLMIGDKKAGGILVESRVSEQIARVVIGLGLNVACAPVPDATSLAEHAHIPMETLAQTATASLLTAIRDPDPAPLSPQLQELSWLKPGDIIRFTQDALQTTAVVVGYDETLTLLVRLDDRIIPLSISFVSRIRRADGGHTP